MKLKRATFYFTLAVSLTAQFCYGQNRSCEDVGKDLANIYSKITPFYYGDFDSLSYYSNVFSTRLTNYVKGHPETLECKFKTLTDSNICGIVTSADGSFRIYSWDTWLGGTMHNFKNLFQFKSNGKIRALTFDYGEGDMGTYFTDVFTLRANDKIYFLGVSGGSESTKDAYETIRAYSISGNQINDSVQLFKTKNGRQNSISIEYDFFSVVDRPERPIKLIKYDSEKK